MQSIDKPLASRGLNPDMWIPFSLIWFGGLSKEQGDLAKKRGLVFAVKPELDENAKTKLKLTNKGLRRLKNRWYAGENYGVGTVYAKYLLENGLVSLEEFYLFDGPVVGNRLKIKHEAVSPYKA